jgi:hypothetical protein
MNTLLQFETPTGHAVYLNPDSVQWIANWPNSAGQSVVEIQMPAGPVKVKGTLEDVARRLVQVQTLDAPKKGKAK